MAHNNTFLSLHMLLIKDEMQSVCFVAVLHILWVCFRPARNKPNELELVISGILVYDNGYFVEDASEIEFCLHFWLESHFECSLYDHNRVDLMNTAGNFTSSHYGLITRVSFARRWLR